MLPPKPSFHFEKISLRAILSLNSYQAPFAPFGSYFKPTSIAQKNSFFLIPVKSAPLAYILSYTFSNKRGTAVITCGFTSFKLSLIFSILSAKYTEIPKY